MRLKKIFLVLLSFTVIAVNAKQNHCTNGEDLQYRNDGTLKTKAYYKNGLLDGIKYEYFNDGKTIKQITTYKEGKKSGMEKFYDRLGILRDFKEN